jgi:hypothetical protein
MQARNEKTLEESRAVNKYESNKVVGREGFEPSKANANRFTVCPL